MSRVFITGTTGDVAQLGERGLCKPEVVGSTPIVSTIAQNKPKRAQAFGFFAYEMLRLPALQSKK